MKAIQIQAPGKVETVEIDTPTISEGMVLLKIDYVGFCGSDINTFRGRNPLVKLPIIPGHEIGAVIESVGKGVPSSFQKGDHATVNPYTNCGHCSACLNKRPNACESNQTLGVQRDGAMSAYLLVPWEKVVIENALSTRDLALVEPLSVGFHATSRAQVTHQDMVLILGCGMIGIGALLSAVGRGAQVTVVDIDDKKLALAQQLGARHVINSKKEDFETLTAQITQKKGFDVVIEAVGHPTTSLAAVQAVAFTGRIVLIGYTKEQVAFDTQYFVKKELDIRGSRNALLKDFQSVINQLKQTSVPLDTFVSGIYSPEQAQRALEEWDKDPGNVFRILIKF